jgi:pantoate--beta-alanine ligase
MRTVTTREELRAAVAAARAGGARIALVPTMGYLHEGHLSLVDAARAAADFVVLSIFVNPLQFGAGEDLERYPRDLRRDAALAAARGVDLVFAPAVEEMYPAGEPRVTLSPGRMAERLCGATRPGHFAGVLTVVAKLFLLAQPDVAVFGRKDFQQAVLIRTMVRDLDFPLDVVVAPTVREADGLALSSRNVYLGAQERRSATALSRALAAAQAAFARGEQEPARLLAAARAVLSADSRVQVQYLELVAPDTLEPVTGVGAGARAARADDVLAVAAFVGPTRLIDNVALA